MKCRDSPSITNGPRKATARSGSGCLGAEKAFAENADGAVQAEAAVVIVSAQSGQAAVDGAVLAEVARAAGIVQHRNIDSTIFKDRLTGVGIEAREHQRAGGGATLDDRPKWWWLPET